MKKLYFLQDNTMLSMNKICRTTELILTKMEEMTETLQMTQVGIETPQMTQVRINNIFSMEYNSILYVNKVLLYPPPPQTRGRQKEKESCNNGIIILYLI